HIEITLSFALGGELGAFGVEGGQPISRGSVRVLRLFEGSFDKGHLPGLHLGRDFHLSGWRKDSQVRCGVFGGWDDTDLLPPPKRGTSNPELTGEFAPRHWIFEIEHRCPPFAVSFETAQWSDTAAAK